MRQIHVTRLPFDMVSIEHGSMWWTIPLKLAVHSFSIAISKKSKGLVSHALRGSTYVNVGFDSDEFKKHQSIEVGPMRMNEAIDLRNNITAALTLTPFSVNPVRSCPFSLFDFLKKAAALSALTAIAVYTGLQTFAFEQNQQIVASKMPNRGEQSLSGMGIKADGQAPQQISQQENKITSANSDQSIVKKETVAGSTVPTVAAPAVDDSAKFAINTKAIKSFDMLSSVSLKNISTAASFVGIPATSGRKNIETADRFYIFSKPGCADCATVDSIVPEIVNLFLPVFMPAGFTDDPVAMRGVANAYCSKQPDIEWMSMSSGLTIPNNLPSNCDWLDRAKSSEVVAILSEIPLEANVWPIIVAPSGAIHIGPVTSKTAATDISEWLFANSRHFKKIQDLAVK
jgi:hypothetical protein